MLLGYAALGLGVISKEVSACPGGHYPVLACAGLCVQSSVHLNFQVFGKELLSVSAMLQHIYSVFMMVWIPNGADSMVEWCCCFSPGGQFSERLMR